MNELQWHEPRAFRRAEYRARLKQNPWEAPKTAAICFAVIFALGAMAKLGNPNPRMLSWPWLAVLAAGVGLGIAYLLPLLLGYISLSIVILSEKGVNNNIVGHGATIYFWSWDEVAYCSFSEATTGGKAYPCLVLHDQDGEVLAQLALGTKPSAQEIQTWLERHKKLAQRR
jgi:hypothetical protein